MDFSVNNEMWTVLTKGIEEDMILGDSNEAENLHKEYHRRKSERKEIREKNAELNKRHEEARVILGLGEIGG
jgi:hypothetical protein